MIAYGYALEPRSTSLEELVTTHAGLVKRIAHHLAARLPSNIEVDDLIQAGMVGLLEAAGNFDASRGASFETFAGIRIRGAMLDDVRKQDWTPRSVHHKQRLVSAAIRRIEAEKGRPAESGEIVEAMGITLEEYHAILRDTVGCQVFSLEESLHDQGSARQAEDTEAAPPDQSLARLQIQRELAAGIERLPEREKLVLSLYYERELNLKEVGAILGVSESRVCQIHGQALLRLRAMLEA
jgi:RNA polymerase sigma factor for flagellar operon FliA